MLKALIETHGISQQELAVGIGRSPAQVSRLANGDSGPSYEVVQATLAFLSARLGRPVRFEECWPVPDVSATGTASTPTPMPDPGEDFAIGHEPGEVR